MALYRRLGLCIQFGKILTYHNRNEVITRGIKRFEAPTIRAINKRLKKAEPLPNEKTKRSSYIDWNLNAEIYAFGERLGEHFKPELLLQAFIHRSYIIQEELKQEKLGIDSPSLGVSDNENLAKEGQHLISSQVKQYLFHNLPRFPLEGILDIHNYLLSDEALAEICKNLGASNIILSADFPVEVETYAKTFKAIVGALAQSQSVDRANLFIRDFVLTLLAERNLNDFFDIQDPFKVLTDILARDNIEPPEPRLIGQSSMNDILASYTVGIYSTKQLIGEGAGETVDIAVEMAARNALQRMFHTTDSSKPLRFDIVNSAADPKHLRLSEWQASVFD